MAAPATIGEVDVMRPARQGDFDGFCGIYSLINALEVAGFSTPRSAVHQRIFVALTDALPNRKLRVAIDRGLKGKDLVRASRVAFPDFEKRIGGEVSISRPFRHSSVESSDAVFRALGALMGTNSAVIIHLSTPAYRHWTVVQAIEPTSIVLRDSWTLRSLPLDRFSTEGRYQVDVRETILVRIKRAEDA